MSGAGDKINLYSIPESQQKRFAKLFFSEMAEFFQNPDNEAEFHEWRRKRREGLGDVKA